MKLENFETRTPGNIFIQNYLGRIVSITNSTDERTTIYLNDEHVNFFAGETIFFVKDLEVPCFLKLSGNDNEFIISNESTDVVLRKSELDNKFFPSFHFSTRR